MILVSTNTSLILLVDAFSGVLLHTFTVVNQNFSPFNIRSYTFSFQGHQNTKNIPLEASFSPDSRYVFCGKFHLKTILASDPWIITRIFLSQGSTDGRIHIWRTADGEKLTTLTTDNSSDSIQTVQFNPKSFMLASASNNMVCTKRHFNIQSFFPSILVLDILVTSSR